MIARKFIIFAFVFLATTAAHATVYVEPLERVIDKQQAIGGGKYIAYPISLERGTKIHAEIRVQGGIDNVIQAWLVDLANFQLLKAGHQFDMWPVGSLRFANEQHYSFVAPTTNVFYIVLDNRSALFARNFVLRVDTDDGIPTAQSRQLTEIYRARYEALKRLFLFPDFDITIRSCGTANSYSNPNILICSELLDEVQSENISGAELFAFSHEVAHSLLNLWRYPTYDNEDSADEFATVLLMFLKRDDAALQAAQWWAQKDSKSELKNKLWINDRHSLSVQRARNILDWLSRKPELERRWLRIMIPNMTDAALHSMAQRAAAQTMANSDDRVLSQEIRDEVKRRQHS